MSNSAAIQTTASQPEARVGAAPIQQRGWLYTTVVIILVAQLPLLLLLATRLWRVEHYQHFPLILIGAGFIVYWRMKDVHRLISGPKVISVSILLVSALLLSGAIVLRSPLLGALSAILSAVGIAFAVGGWQLIRRLLPVWILLCFALPLPLGLDLRLILYLQGIATYWGSGVLDLLGYRHLVDGVVIALPNETFEVEEACSGIHSLFSTLSLTLFYLIYVQRPVFRAILVLLSAVFWVLVTNGLRVVLVTTLTTTWNLPVAEGIGHHILGTVMFLLCLGLVISTDRLLLFISPLGQGWGKLWQRLFRQRNRTDVSPSNAAPPPPKKGARRAPERSTLPAPFGFAEGSLIIAVFGLLIAVQAIGVGAAMAKGNLGSPQLAVLVDDDATLLPQQIHGWQQISYQEQMRKESNRNGARSRIWTFKKGQNTVLVSIDGPFIGWHDLTNCLECQGWVAEERRNVAYRDTGEDLEGGFTEIVAHNGVSRRALVLFAVFDGENRPLVPTGGRLQHLSKRRFPQVSELWNRVTGKEVKSVGRADSRTFQIQIFAERFVEMQDEELIELREVFHVVRRLVTGNDSSADPSANERQQAT